MDLSEVAPTGVDQQLQTIFPRLGTLLQQEIQVKTQTEDQLNSLSKIFFTPGPSNPNDFFSSKPFSNPWSESNDAGSQPFASQFGFNKKNPFL